MQSKQTIPWTREPEGGWTPEQVKAEAIAWFREHPERCVEDVPPGLCAYRNEQGRACAVGIFVTDDEAEHLTGLVADVWHEIEGHFKTDLGFDWVEFLSDLQGRHDEQVVSQYDSIAERIALMNLDDYRHGGA